MCEQLTVNGIEWPGPYSARGNYSARGTPSARGLYSARHEGPLGLASGFCCILGSGNCGFAKHRSRGV